MHSDVGLIGEKSMTQSDHLMTKVEKVDGLHEKKLYDEIL